MTSVTININVGGKEEKKEPQRKTKTLHCGDHIKSPFVMIDGVLYAVRNGELTCVGAAC